jgi:integrase
MPRRRPRCKRPHRTGTYYQCGDRHVVQWTDAAGKRRTKSFTEKEAALRHLSVETGKAAAGLVDGHVVDKKVLATYAGRWMEHHVHESSWYDQRCRWENHLLPLLGQLRPDEVTPGVLKEVLRTLRGKGLSNGSLRLCVALVSAIYSDLVEDGVVDANPARALSRKTREEFLWSKGDPLATPWLERVEDVLRLHAWLLERNPSVARAYAIGALAGLRTGEIRALATKDLDFGRRLITVRHTVERRTGRVWRLLSEDGTSETKSGRERVVPMSDLLGAHLGAWARASGWGGIEILVCPARGRGGRTFRGLQFLSEHLMARLLREGLAALGLPDMTWYQATRHTFASQWVAAGGDVRKLSEMMGHGSVQVTERHYIHLAPGRFTDADRALVRAPSAA